MDVGSVYSDEQMSSMDGEPGRDRMDDLEKRLRQQGDEIVLLRSVIAELVRRVSDLENSASRTQRDRSLTMNGSTLTLPTKSSTTRSTSSRPSLTSSSSPMTHSGGKLSTHHMSTESLQSSSTLHNNRQSLGSTGSSYGALRNSPSIDRLATPRISSGGGTTARTFVSSSPSPSSAKSTPMRKWTSNSDFQNGSSTSSHTLPSPGHNTQQMVSSTTSQRRQYGSQSHLNNDVQPASFAAAGGLSTYRAAAHKESVFNPDDGYLHVNIRGKGMNFYVPSVECMTNSLQQPNPPPNQRLKLEWVYGYRGRDCRSNLHQIATGDSVYFIASVVVLVNFQDGVQRHYLGHTDDIRCLTVHPNKMIIASGQTGSPDKKKRNGGSSPVADEKMVHIRVWDSVSLNTLQVIGGYGDFEKGFCCLAFSRMDGGALLVAIDESPDHVLTLWDWQKAGTRGDRITAANCGPDAIFACEFHPSVPNLMITCGKSSVHFWTLDGSSLSFSRVAGSFERVEKPKFVLCLCFSENGDIITGDSNGNIISWGRAGNRARNIVTNAHAGGVFALFPASDGTLISGGKDRRLVAWDQDLNRTGNEFELADNYGTARVIAQTSDSTLLIGTNRNCILQGDFIQGFTVAVQGHFDEIWALATHPNHDQFITASYDHFLTLWSSSEKAPIWSTEMQDGVHAVCFHPDGDLIAVATISGRWFVLDTLSKEIVTSQAVNGDTQDLLSSIKYSPDGRFIAVASVDRNIYIYQILEGGTKCQKLGKCVGHSSAVLCLDWSVDSQYLRSNSDNFELIYWNPSTLKQMSNAALCRDVEWDSCNCILEYGVSGVWSEAVQALSVDCTRATSNRVLAVGDDGGKVKLFSFPAMSLKSQCHTYSGHSNHVSTVRFLHDDSRLISAGGRDASVLQWIVS